MMTAVISTASPALVSDNGAPAGLACAEVTDKRHGKAEQKVHYVSSNSDTTEDSYSDSSCESSSSAGDKRSRERSGEHCKAKKLSKRKRKKLKSRKKSRKQKKRRKRSKRSSTSESDSDCKEVDIRKVAKPTDRKKDSMDDVICLHSQPGTSNQNCTKGEVRSGHTSQPREHTTTSLGDKTKLKATRSGKDDDVQIVGSVGRDKARHLGKFEIGQGRKSSSSGEAGTVQAVRKRGQALPSQAEMWEAYQEKKMAVRRDRAARHKEELKRQKLERGEELSTSDEETGWGK